MVRCPIEPGFSRLFGAFLLWNEKKVVPLFHDAMNDVRRSVSTFRAVAFDATEYSRKCILFFRRSVYLVKLRKWLIPTKNIRAIIMNFSNTPRICYMVKGMIGNH
jgi:hypothetical protein